MSTHIDAIIDRICRSLATAAHCDQPYRHFYADDFMPEALTAALARLPIERAERTSYSGERDDPNAVRFYVNDAAMRRFPVLAALAKALQAPPVVHAIRALTAAPLEGTHLRLEYAVDRDGFWLKPHTDLGEKKFTCLISLAETEHHADLGTDIYDAGRPVKRAPFRRSGALMFVPGAKTWHGFQKRRIAGLRRSLILNYVGPGWRARDHLAFPDQPVAF